MILVQARQREVDRSLEEAVLVLVSTIVPELVFARRHHGLRPLNDAMATVIVVIISIAVLNASHIELSWRRQRLRANQAEASNERNRYFRDRRTRLSQHDHHALETGAAFWHMVDLLWIVLFPLVYVMR